MKFFKTTLLALSMSLLLTGCGGDNSNDSSGSQGSGSQGSGSQGSGSQGSGSAGSIDVNSLFGLWENKNTNNDLLTLAFLDDGTYIHLEVDEVAPFDTANETSGMEWGNYTLDNITGKLTVSQRFDNNGDTGLSGTHDRYISVSGNILTIRVDENNNGVIDSNESFIFSKAKSENVLGFWKNDTTDNDLLAFAFFDNGTYVHLEVDEVAPFDTANETSGMEWGNYTLDNITGKLTVSQRFDNNGDTGLTDNVIRYLKVSGDTLMLEFDENKNGVIDKSGESLDFQRQ